MKSADKPATGQPAKDAIADLYPLTPMQHGMLFHSLYAPASGVYIEQFRCVLRGDLDTAAFAEAWRQVIEQYAVLRTAFAWEGLDDPMQVVFRTARAPLERHDWRELDRAAQRERLEAFLEADRRQGFALNRAPLLRLALVQTTDDTHQFIWTSHHILLDGWSVSRVFNSLLGGYDALSHGGNISIKPTRPYRDYIAWLRRQDLARAEVYWRELLRGFAEPTRIDSAPEQSPISNPSTTLRTGLQSPTEPVGGYQQRSIGLSQAATAALQTFARQQQVTLNTLVQGAWALLLGRYSGAADVLFGIVVSGRPADLLGVEDMVGLFTNVLPLRAELPPMARLGTWLRQLQQQQIEARQYEYSPLLQIQRWSEIPHGQPLFESILVFENHPATTAHEQRRNLAIEEVQLVERTHYPLTLLVVPVPTLTLTISFDGARFDAATIERMLAHFQTLLAGMAAHADQPLARLPLMDADERQQVLHTWNDTAAPYPHNTHLAALFAAQVGRSPDAIALVEDEVQLSYAALARQAHQLAHTLQGCGVGPEVVVALALPRSLPSVVALLAIYAAGGAVVPLDPSHPAAHLAAILADTQPAVILTAARFLAALPECPAQVLCLDADQDRIAAYPTSVPLTSVSASHLAHIVYTSGSTGVPKGVAVPQRQLLHRLAWAAHAHPLCPSDRVALRTAPSFSVAFAELLNPLLQGATAVLLPDPDAYDPPRLLAALHHHALSHLILVPTLLRALLDTLDAEERPLPLLRVLVVCGEVLPPDLVRRAQTHMPATCLLHQYGASEVNDVTLYNATTLPAQAGRVPLGSPISNMQVYLLDQHLQPVPIGLPGLLYVGGLGLARGYHNRPDLTAERFVPNPFAENKEQRIKNKEPRTEDGHPPSSILHPPSSRLYAMGDLARWRADGRLEYLGRKDQQVKLRGVRVDLAGIEALLRAQGGVAQAAALLRNPEAGKGAEGDGTARLLAYVAPQEGQALDGRALRRALAARLPSGQVPEQVLVLPELPRTPSGKLARRALAELAPEVAPEPGTTTEAGPRTPLEELVGRIWASVLGREAVGRDDNFFELGGHSLLATQVVARVREVCGVELPLRVLFEAPTLAELTEQIAALRSEGVALVLPPITPVARTGAEPLSFAQQRLWFLEQLHPGNPFYNEFHGRAAERLDRPGGPGAGPERRDRPPRGATHHLRFGRRATGRGDCAGPGDSFRGDRSARRPTGAARGARLAAGARGGAAPIRPGARATHPGGAAAAGHR